MVRTAAGALTILVALLLASPAAEAQTTAAVAAAGPAAAAPPRTVVQRDEAGRITIEAVRLERPLVMDGRLEDEIYTLIGPVGGFIQQEPDEGQPATEPTDVWVFFDDRNVYISARCWDSQPDRMVANEMRRDSQTIQENDNFVVMLDTFYDRRNGYFFQTNPIGGLRDQEVLDEGSVNNRDWNAVWDAKVTRDDRGWSTEMVIPFKSLRFRATGDQTWGINFRRMVRSKNETSNLTPLPASYGPTGVFRFSLAATLVGVTVPGGSRNFELKPYAKSGLNTDRTASPAVSNDATGDVGFDVKYGLTKGITADFTVNTDFAQVEEDEQQVNLTRFSLFFPEKRDFFLENQGVFSFGGVSGRPGGGGGGAGGPGGPSLVPIMFFSRRIGINNGREVPLLAGARATGRAGAYTMGFVNIQTAESDEAGAEATNFSVVRLRRDVLRRSAIGVIATHRAQRPGGAPGSNQVFGVDGTFAFYENIELATYYARTQTPDLDGDASSYRGRFDYDADRYGLNLEHLSVGEDFNPEIGFMRRQDFRRNYGKVRFSPRLRTNRVIRKLNWEASLDYITDPDWNLETREVIGAFRIDFQSSDQWGTELTRSYEFLAEPFEISPGVLVSPGGYDFQQYSTFYDLGPQHMVAGRFSVGRGSFYSGTRTEAGYSNGRLDLGAHLGIEPRVTVNWVDLPVGDFTTTVVSTRVSFTMSPRMAVSGLVQYNSSASLMSSNIRYRWEYQPGSDFYVVYSDGRNTELSGFPTLQNRSFIVKVTRLMRW